MIKLAIVSPCYNEEEVLEESTTRLTALFDDLVAKKKISADSFVLFVNDGSKDRTWSIIKQLHRTNPYIKGMNLARNVGHQYAIMAGMMTAKDWSDAVITIDADLQDDLNAIEEMIDAYTWRYGNIRNLPVSSILRHEAWIRQSGQKRDRQDSMCGTGKGRPIHRSRGKSAGTRCIAVQKVCCATVQFREGSWWLLPSRNRFREYRSIGKRNRPST